MIINPGWGIVYLSICAIVSIASYKAGKTDQKNISDARYDSLYVDCTHAENALEDARAENYELKQQLSHAHSENDALNEALAKSDSELAVLKKEAHHHG